MGTGKSGRYLSTKGSGRSVSDYAVVHALEGTFTYDQNGHISRMKSGGHGQENMEILKKAGIEYTVVKTYANGVRIGSISKHKDKAKRERNAQACFPKGWTKKDIKRAGSHVAGLKKNRKAKDGQPVFGMYKGVRVGVIKTNGKIATVFPDINQPGGRKGKK